MVRIATKGAKVYKEECMFCFNNPESPGGLFVSLENFYGVCPNHLRMHVNKTGDKEFVHVSRKRTALQTEKQDDGDGVKKPGEPEQKVTKLAIGVEGGFQTDDQKYKFEDTWSYLLWTPEWTPEQPLVAMSETPEPIQMALVSIQGAESAYRLQELESLAGTWDGSFKVETKHTDLKQLPNPPKIPPTGWRCQAEGCDKTDNLWLNLTDGSILCGRRYHDGSGGNHHAVESYEKTGYPLAVKLGTITPYDADVFSYDEDDMVIDPKLKEHLLHFGICMMEMEKTEKTMLELELVQTLCLIPDVQKQYFEGAARIFEQVTGDPAEDFGVQMAKFVSGLLSGNYSPPPPSTPSDQESGKESPTISGINAVKPLIFRSLVGRGHSEFSTHRQQDAEEYLRWLCEKLENSQSGENALSALRFKVKESFLASGESQSRVTLRKDCILSLPIPLEATTNLGEFEAFEARRKEAEGAGKKLDTSDVVRRRVPLQACFEKLSAEEVIDGYFSENLNKTTTATITKRLVTFPDFLFVQIQKFTISPEWVPVKLDVAIEMPPDDVIDLEWLRGPDLGPDDVVIDEASKKTSPAAEAIQVDESVVSQLQDMGFPADVCRKAVVRTQNSGLEAATNWVMEHMEDPDFYEPLPSEPRSGGHGSGGPGQGSTGSAAVDPGLVEQLTAITGFTEQQARRALKERNNDLNSAAEWLFMNPTAEGSEAPVEAMETGPGNPPVELKDGPAKYKLVGFISHMGSSTHCGHYVAHLLKDGHWLIFNDEKVAYSEHPPKELAYIYVFQRLTV